MTTIRCLYTCDGCGLSDVPVEVPEREEKQDVVHWVQGVAAAMIAADHKIRSPRCTAERMTMMKIPLPAGTARLGEVPRS